MSEFQKDKYRFSSVAPLTVAGETVVEERKEQIIDLVDELLSYAVVLKDLTYIEVSHNIRNELLNIAFYIIRDIELYDEFMDKKELPVAKICRKIVKPRKFIEEHKEYIITYVTILGNPGYKLIQDYLNVIEDNKSTDDSSITVFSEENNTRGMVFSKKKSNAIIMTSMGEFKRIKIIEDTVVGEDAEGYKRKSLKNYRLQLSILAILVIITVGLGIYKYNKVVTTVVVDSYSTIKLDVNFLDKVVKVYTSEGTSSKTISKNEILDRDLDTTLYKIIKFYDENGMLNSKIITVTISGKFLEYGSLRKTQDYTKEKSIEVRINNNGMEQKLY